MRLLDVYIPPTRHMEGVGDLGPELGVVCSYGPKEKKTLHKK